MRFHSSVDLQTLLLMTNELRGLLFFFFFFKEQWSFLDTLYPSTVRQYVYFVRLFPFNLVYIFLLALSLLSYLLFLVSSVPFSAV